jgi:hypothetical protein
MKTLLSLLVAALLTAGGLGAAPPAGAGSNGYAYTLNNDGMQNGVVVLSRNDDGTLTRRRGRRWPRADAASWCRPWATSAGLGAFTASVLAVNPGSNSIAVPPDRRRRLTPVDGSRSRRAA